MRPRKRQRCGIIPLNSVQTLSLPAAGSFGLRSPPYKCLNLDLPGLLHLLAIVSKRSIHKASMDQWQPLDTLYLHSTWSSDPARKNSTCPRSRHLWVSRTLLQEQSFKLIVLQHNSSICLSRGRSNLLPTMDVPTLPLPLLQPRPLSVRALRQKPVALLPYPRLPPSSHDLPSLHPPRSLPITLPSRTTHLADTSHKNHEKAACNFKPPDPFRPLLHLPQRSTVHLPSSPTATHSLRCPLLNLFGAPSSIPRPQKPKEQKSRPPHYPRIQLPPRSLHNSPLSDSPPNHHRVPSLPHPRFLILLLSRNNNRRLSNTLPLHPLAITSSPPNPKGLGPLLPPATASPRPRHSRHLPRRSRPVLRVSHALALIATGPASKIARRATSTASGSRDGDGGCLGWGGI